MFLPRRAVALFGLALVSVLAAGAAAEPLAEPADDSLFEARSDLEYTADQALARARRQVETRAVALIASAFPAPSALVRGVLELTERETATPAPATLAAEQAVCREFDYGGRRFYYAHVEWRIPATRLADAVADVRARHARCRIKLACAGLLAAAALLFVAGRRKSRAPDWRMD